MKQYIPDITERFPEGYGGVDMTPAYFGRDFAFKIKSSPFCQGSIWQNGEFSY